jgi:hypothetical protein
MAAWKIVLICLGAFILLIAALVGGGYFWWQSNGDALIADARTAEAEGTRFAAGKDDLACVDEAIARVKGGAMFIGGLKAQSFLTSCLRSARLVGGFCDGVPGPDEVLKSITWNQQRTSEYGLGPSEAPFVIQTIQRFCASSAVKAAAGPDCSAFKSVDGQWQATKSTTIAVNTANGNGTVQVPAGTALRRKAFNINGVDPVDLLDQRCRL